jgi:hypothetical protein
LEALRSQRSFDPNDPSSTPTIAQAEILADFGIIKTQWIVASNRSGKSQTCAKLVGNTITDSHETWKVPEAWKSEGLLILICGRSGKIMEESLWPKIRSYLPEGSYKEIKVGNILQKVEVTNPDGPKHRLIFQSMENPRQARERIQSYDAHIAWADEMIDFATVLNEIRLRVTTKHGLFLSSFTPLNPSPEVKKLVDGAALPHAKRYNLLTLDNPVFQTTEAKEQLLSTFVGMSSQEIATRLRGEWAISDGRVYKFDPDTMIQFPEGYSTTWRHVEAVDPAIQSKFGYTLWAEDPATAYWYCIKAKYIEGIYDPVEIFNAVQKESANVNVTKRVSDVAPWYTRTAATKQVYYATVRKKNDRKEELIKGYQEKLGKRVFLSPDVCDLLVTETLDCRWSERTDGKIVNGSKYHLIDSAHYFCDAIPPAEKQVVASSWHQHLRQANEQRQIGEQKKLQQAQARKQRYLISRRPRGRRVN